MTVTELAAALSLKQLSGSEESLSAAVTGGYSGDLLSWVMGRAPTGGVWLTIMSNINVAAVATLGEIACVVLCESVEPDPPLLERAKNDGIALFQSAESAFTLAGRIAPLI